MKFTLDTGSGVPVYRQLIQQIENAAASGRMKAGDKLPTIRALSVELKVNPNTISKAYNELEIRGILTTQVGSGTFISAQRPEVHDDWKEKKIQEAVFRFLREMDELGVDTDAAVLALRNAAVPNTSQ
ncbi:MAG: GntR family transcriptional regulator [Spirochaetaceae bacterium]|jgi:GntR family transcriptional regulator|nr:GntR family transcriptional regulator [Spirochaetaceae bacterium]